MAWTPTLNVMLKEGSKMLNEKIESVKRSRVIVEDDVRKDQDQNKVGS